MEALLAEGRKRRFKTTGARAPVAPADVGGKANSKRSASSSGLDTGDSLSKLVEQVKRKAGDAGGRGKRAKVDG
jgi:hypothetical protein